MKKLGKLDKAQSCFQKAFALDPSLKEKQEKENHDSANLSFGSSQVNSDPQMCHDLDQPQGM